MAQYRCEIEYHLTPRGWIAGLGRSQTDPHDVVDLPPDRVETWLFRMVRTAGWEAEGREWRIVWKSPTVSAVVRRALRRSFPMPGKDCSWSELDKPESSLSTNSCPEPSSRNVS